MTNKIYSAERESNCSNDRKQEKSRKTLLSAKHVKDTKSLKKVSGGRRKGAEYVCF